MAELPGAVFQLHTRVASVDNFAPWEPSQIDIRHVLGGGAADDRRSLFGYAENNGTFASPTTQPRSDRGEGDKGCPRALVA